MRTNIKDIMKATKCTEERALKIEDKINNDWLLDWSECSMGQLNKIACDVNKSLSI